MKPGEDGGWAAKDHLARLSAWERKISPSSRLPFDLLFAVPPHRCPKVLDGTAKGGIVLAIREHLGVPMRFVGTGERIEDLEPFDPKTFAESLVRG